MSCHHHYIGNICVFCGVGHHIAQEDEIAELKAAKERAEACAAEMREALEQFKCGTCHGSHWFTPECYACLCGESPCSCCKEEPQPCPQCCDDGKETLRDEYGKLEHALSTSCGVGWLSPEKVKELNDEIGNLRERSMHAEQAALEMAEKVDELEAENQLMRESLQHIATNPSSIASQHIARETLDKMKE